MKIAICDDQQSSLECVKSEVLSLDIPCEIALFQDIQLLYREIGLGRKYDVVFMDIEWYGEQRGIDFAANLYKLCPKTRIVFITGYPERYSQQIFFKYTNLKGFIAKPIDKAILLDTLMRIKGEIQDESKSHLVIKFNGAVASIDPDDIFYLESRAHKITIHTGGENHLCYEKLDVLAEELPENFIFTHKSFLVNMDKIQRIEREYLILANNEEVPISKSRFLEMREKYFRYIGFKI